MKKEKLKKHSVAPYNFISLPNRSIAEYDSMDELTKHNELSDKLLNGTIEFDITAKTPLLIAKGKDKNNSYNNQIDGCEFFTNPENQKVIPGNTIRGMLRNNAAVLSMSNISDDICDSRFYFRSFNATSTQKDYRERMQISSVTENGVTYSIAKTIHAGYIYKNNERDYVIVPGKKINGEQYFRISEQYLRRISKNLKINYMYNNNITDLIDNKSKYKNDRIKKSFLKQNKNKNYKPYCIEISFELKDKRHVKSVTEKNRLKNNGYLISSNYLYGKLAHYIINEPDFNSNEILELNEKNQKIKFIEFYEDDLIRTKKANPEKNEKDPFFALPEKCGKENGKAIFYGEFKNKIYLGFTPYFRIPYDKSIKDGIKNEYKENKKISYCDSIFGFANKQFDKNAAASYKGKISIEDAVYEGKINLNSNIKEEDSYKVILAEPHASYFTGYLMQSETAGPKDLLNYNDKFEIRGIKQYWQKDYIEYITGNAKENKRITSNLMPVKIGSIFKGKIHFNNLTEEELGLVLWALKVDENATENIGMGKPFGFGRIDINNINVKVEDLSKKYSSMTIDFYSEENKEKYIKIYKENFKKKFSVDLNVQNGVKELITMKTTVVPESKSNEARYMEISSDLYKDENRGNQKNEFVMGLPLLNIMKQSEIIKKK